MAKFIIEYDIHVGDEVMFVVSDATGNHRQTGTVQDISQLPDVWVEGFQDGKYKRWKKDVTRLMVFDSDHDSGFFSKAEFEDNEPVEFVHRGEVGTGEFEELEYRTREQ